MTVTCDLDFNETGYREGYFHLRATNTHSAYRRLSIPICNYRSSVDGPTILLVSGFHGDEYEGQVVNRSIMQELRNHKLDILKGRIIIVPSLNLPACITSTRFSPHAPNGIEHVSVGNSDDLSKKILSFLEDTLIPKSDVYIDLHSGGASLDYLPIAIAFVKGNHDMDQRNRHLLQSFCAPYSMVRKANDIPCRAFEIAHAQGCVYIATELGGGTTLSSKDIEIGRRGIFAIMGNMGMLDVPKLNENSIWIETDTRVDHIFSEDAGIFVPEVKLGDRVKKESIVGKIHRVDRVGSNSIISIKTKKSGIILAKRSMNLCRRGDCLFELGHEF